MKKYVLLTIVVSISIMIGLVGVFASFQGPVGGFLLIEQKKTDSIMKSLENLKSAEEKLEENQIIEAKKELEETKTLLRNNDYHFEANQVNRIISLIEQKKIGSAEYLLNQVQDNLEAEANKLDF